MNRTGAGETSAARTDAGGTVALILNVVAWGATPVLLKALTGHVDAWTANGLRYPLAACLYLPFVVRAARTQRIPTGAWRRALIPASLALSGQVLWALSPYYVSAELMAFLIKASIPWALFGAMILFPSERLLLRSRAFYGGLGLAAVGFVGLSYLGGAFEHSVTGVGVVIVFFCGLFFGLYGVSVRFCLHDTPPAFAFGIVSQYVGACTFVLMLVLGTTPIASVMPSGWILLVASSLIGIALSHTFFYIAIQRLGPSIAASAHLVGPFVTLALTRWFFARELSAAEWVSGVAMVAGGGLLLRAQSRVVAGQT